MPQALVPSVAAEPSGPRFLMSSTTYPGLLPLIDSVCRKYQVSRTMVLMHAIAWLFAQYARLPRVLCTSTIGNRLPGDDSIDCVSRMMDVLMEFGEERTVEESLAAVSAATLRSYTEEVRLGPRSEDARALLAEGAA
ncbi:hypothetical protein NKH77_54875 [Streptomyces sp. M19]